MSKKYIPVENKLPVGPKKKNFEDLTAESKWSRVYYENNPDKRQQKLKRQAEYYIENRGKIVKRKKRKGGEQLLKAIKILGGKCAACGELFNSNLKRSNLEIHHWYYDDKDLKIKQRYGVVMTPNVRHVLKMAKNVKNSKKKFTLFCHQCHMIETYAHQDERKTRSIFSWLITNKHLDSLTRSGIIVDDSDIFHLEAIKCPTEGEEEVQIIVREWN